MLSAHSQPQTHTERAGQRRVERQALPKEHSVPTRPPLQTWGAGKDTGGRSKNRKSRIRSTRMRGNLCTVSFLVLRVFCRHRSHTWINVQRRVAVPLTSTGFSNTLTRIRTCYASRYFHTLWATPLCPRSLGYT